MTAKKLTSVLSLFSPRWGRADTYRVTFNLSSIEVQCGQGFAKHATFDPALGVWGGHIGGLTGILHQDKIYPPDTFISALVTAWGDWAEGRLTNDEGRARVTELAAWVDATTHAQPAHEYWTRVL